MTNSPFESDRRQFERRPLRTVAVMTLTGQASGVASYDVRTADISTGGLAVVSQKHVLPGSRVSVWVRLPGGGAPGKALEVMAEVMHSILAGSVDGFKVGLSFVELNASATETIAQYISAA